MTDLRDRLDQIVQRHGEQWLIDHINVRFPETESAFIARLYDEIDSITQELESSAAFTSTEDEERLSNRVISLLRRTGYDADAETENRGHVDIIVRHRDRGWVWLAECKIHGAYEYLHEGLKQLLTRYSTGRFPWGGMIIFIKNLRGGDVVGRWHKYIAERGLEHFIRFDESEKTRFCFRSVHDHQNTGTEFIVRHVGVMLHYKPQDKSAIASSE